MAVLLLVGFAHFQVSIKFKGQGKVRYTKETRAKERQKENFFCYWVFLLKVKLWGRHLRRLMTDLGRETSRGVVETR